MGMLRGVTLAAGVCCLALFAANAVDLQRAVSVAPCAPRVARGSLPVWARGGFHPPAQHIPHTLGHSGRIVAILFGYPFESPPPQDHSNKILWVARMPVNGLTSLRIEAQRMRGARRVGSAVGRIVHGGPGPSIIDLPAAGCWRLDLRWAGRTDTLDLRYAPRP